MTTTSSELRLTQYAAGGGCACKVPPGELERVLAGLPGGRAGGDLLVGVEHGDDGAAVRIDGGRAVIATADFFTPVVDDAYDWGRIAAANALSDVYAMGGEPLLAINLLAWPRDLIPFELAAEVLRGGADVCAEAATHLAGGHSIDDREPKYGLAVTGFADADRLLRNDAADAGHRADPDQAAGARRPEQPAQGDRRAVRPRRRRDDQPQPGRLAGGRRGRRTRGHGRHRLRPARPPLQDGAGQRRDRRRRRGRRALPRRRPRVAAATASSRAAAGATSTGCGPTSTPPWTRTSWCCSPTPRPPAASWSRASCRATRSSASWSRRGSSRSWFDDFC